MSTAVLALWGVGGAFIFAAPNWLTCLAHCRSSGEPVWTCAVEFVIALVTGAIAAAATARVAADFSPIKDPVFIAATVGLLANTTAPLLTKSLPAIVASRFGAKVPASTGEAE